MELLSVDQYNLNSQFPLCPLFLAGLSFVVIHVFLRNIAVALVSFSKSGKMLYSLQQNILLLAFVIIAYLENAIKCIH